MTSWIGGGGGGDVITPLTVARDRQPCLQSSLKGSLALGSLVRSHHFEKERFHRERVD